MGRKLLMLLFALTLGACGKAGSHATAPTPVPDNPNAPAVTGSIRWLPSPSMVVLVATDEDVVLTSMLVSVWQDNTGAVQLRTDAINGTILHQGQADTVRITTWPQSGAPYVWNASDHHFVQANGRRPGQSTLFHFPILTD